MSDSRHSTSTCKTRGNSDGGFTTDAVAIVEKHNVDGKLPFIELWADSRLETQLSQRPDLIASYGLRS